MKLPYVAAETDDDIIDTVFEGVDAYSGEKRVRSPSPEEVPRQPHNNARRHQHPDPEVNQKLVGAPPFCPTGSPPKNSDMTGNPLNGRTFLIKSILQIDLKSPPFTHYPLNSVEVRNCSFFYNHRLVFSQ